MANRNRIALNQSFFSGLIDHANQRGAEIQNRDEGRWLSRLSPEDADLMAKADVSSVKKLTKTLRVAELHHKEKIYFIFWGLSEVQEIPEGLAEIDVTPALFLISAVEAQVSPNATGLEIKQEVEDLYKGVADYDGHGLAEILALYPSCQAFVANPDFEFTQSLSRVIGTMIARSYENGPIEMASETLEVASELFETGSSHLPFEVILQGLMSISWRGFYLGLYRCIEQLFPVSALAKFVEKSGDVRPIIDLAELLESQLAWRPKEDISLEGLVQGVAKELVSEFVSSFELKLEADADEARAVAKRIYSLRNGMVHFRPGVAPDDDLGEEREDLVLRSMMKLVAELYSMHGAEFHGHIQPAR